MIDWRFIQALEGLRTRGYVPDHGSSQSGVTIGSGVDLGHWSVDQLRRRRVPEPIIRRIRPYLGLRGDDAIEVAGELELSPEDADTLSRIIQGDIVDALRQRYGRSQEPGTLRWDYLPSAAATVITSVAFQYGPPAPRNQAIWMPPFGAVPRARPPHGPVRVPGGAATPQPLRVAQKWGVNTLGRLPGLSDPRRSP